MLYKLLSFIYGCTLLLSCEQHITIETSVGTEPIIVIEDSKDVESNFEIFYVQFISDSTFQMNHIHWPIEGKYMDYENEYNWTKENWDLITWDFKNELNTEFDSISFIETDSMTHLSYHCLDCGYSFAMQFKKINDDWKLVFRQDNNF